MASKDVTGSESVWDQARIVPQFAVDDLEHLQSVSTMKFIDLSDIVFRRSREVWKSTKYLPVARKEGLLGHRGELLRSNHIGLDHRQSRPGLVLTLK
jgi:hypothetical protein